MLFRKLLLLTLLLFISFASSVFAQDGILRGIVRDSTGKGLEAVSVSIVGQAGGAISDIRGRYEIHIPPYKDITIGFSTVGYSPFTITVQLTPG